jgi:hypothetical protein
MTRINQFGEIVRDTAPPAPTTVGRSTARQQYFWAVVGGVMLAGAVLLGALGMLVGYGAGERWCHTEPAAEGAWQKGVGSFFHTVYLASWSSQPVQHAVSDASTPVRLVVVAAVLLWLTVVIVRSAAPNEQFGTLGSALFWDVPLSMALSALLRLVFHLLTWPVTWFVGDVSGPYVGMFAVGLGYTVVGAVLGFFVGLLVAALHDR